MLENISFWTYGPSCDGATHPGGDVIPARELPSAPRHASLQPTSAVLPLWQSRFKSGLAKIELNTLRFKLGKVLSWSQTTVADSKYAVTGPGVCPFLLHGKALGQPRENMALPSCAFMAWKSKQD